MSKLIVGCGYLGLRVAAAWRERGERVLATTRSAERADWLKGRGLEPVVCDVLDPGSLRALPAAEAVVYCVGLDRGAGVPMRRVYVEGLTNVLAALPGAPRLVYVSSTSVYGQEDGSWVGEEAATEPAEGSGRVVLEAEATLRAARPDAVVLRFAGIYGPDRLFRARDLLAGTPLNVDPGKWLNLIHVEDGAAAVLAAVERGAGGRTYNVCDDRPVTRRDFYEALAEALGAPAPAWGSAAESDRVNRRVSNARMKGELGVRLRYPSCAEGLNSPSSER